MFTLFLSSFSLLNKLFTKILLFLVYSVLHSKKSSALSVQQYHIKTVKTLK